MDRINFTSDWNNKLALKCVPTFRVDSKRYKIGTKFEVWKGLKTDKSNNVTKGVYLGHARLVARSPLRLSQVTDTLAYIDTGYSREEFVNIVRKMYGARMDVDQAKFVLIVLKFDKIDRP